MPVKTITIDKGSKARIAWHNPETSETWWRYVDIADLESVRIPDSIIRFIRDLPPEIIRLEISILESEKQ